MRRSGSRTAPGPGHAASTAQLVALGWLGSVGPSLDMPALDMPEPPVTGYVDQLLVEDIDYSIPPTVIVTLTGIVLQPDDEGTAYERTRVVRLAVPVRVDGDGAHPAGAPWLLAPPETDVRTASWRRIDDPGIATAAGEALTTAGYRQIQIDAVERGQNWPLRVRVTAVAPGGDTAAEHIVRLRDHLGDLIVAGTLPRTSADREGEGQPDGSSRERADDRAEESAAPDGDPRPSPRPTPSPRASTP